MESKLKAPGMDRAGEVEDIRSAALEVPLHDFNQLKLASWTDLENYGEKFCEGFNAGVAACATASSITSPAKAQGAAPADDYQLIAHLIGIIFMAGDFKAETANERQLEALLVKTGHRYADWAEVDAINERSAALAAPVENSEQMEDPGAADSDGGGA